MPAIARPVATRQTPAKPSRALAGPASAGPAARARFAAMPKRPIASPRRAAGTKSVTTAAAAVGKRPIPVPWIARTRRSDHAERVAA